MATSFLCFCGTPAKSFRTRTGGSMYYCGTSVDFEKLCAIYKMRTSKEKDEALQQVDLGCNMRFNDNEISFLQTELKEFPDKSNFPKCNHNLIAKLGICSSERNNGRLFFTCNAKIPDVSCQFFEWYDNNTTKDNTNQKLKRSKQEEQEEKEEHIETKPTKKVRFSK